MELVRSIGAMEHGVVLSFDEDGGYGQVASGEGAERFFHCTAVSGGARTIPVGARVAFNVAPGRSGLWEAINLSRC